MLFKRVEKILFFLLVAAHLIPLFIFDFFVTHDGPAHTYNTVLIEDMLSGENYPAKSFFEFTSDPQPNWGYNAIMLITDRVLSPAVSERLIIAMVIVLLAFSFRGLIVQLNPGNAFQSYFVLPFLFSFHLYLGFFNFCIGAAVLFFLLCYAVKKSARPAAGYFVVISLVSLLMLFSHAFSFMLFSLCIAGYVTIQHHMQGRKIFSAEFLKKIFTYLLALLPSLVFCLFFLFTRYDSQGKKWLGAGELFRYLYECGPAITLTYEPERIYGLTITGLAVINILMVIYFRARQNQRKFSQHDFWLLIAALTLILYFILPDAVGVWGFISLRTLMFVFLFLPAWFAAGYFPAWWKYLQVGVFAVMITSRLHYQYGLSKNLDADAREMVSLKEKIKPGSVILPLDYFNNWMHDNISNYLGTYNHNVVLDNYEAVFPHFPLHWKKEVNPYRLVGNFAGRVPPCADVNRFENATGIKIDYVVRWMYHDDQDSCTAAVNRQLEANYMLVTKSPNGVAELFERKR